MKALWIGQIVAGALCMEAALIVGHVPVGPALAVNALLLALGGVLVIAEALER